MHLNASTARLGFLKPREPFTRYGCSSRGVTAGAPATRKHMGGGVPADGIGRHQRAVEVSIKRHAAFHRPEMQLLRPLPVV